MTEPNSDEIESCHPHPKREAERPLFFMQRGCYCGRIPGSRLLGGGKGEKCIFIKINCMSYIKIYVFFVNYCGLTVDMRNCIMYVAICFF
jgi:hypothetical protein